MEKYKVVIWAKKNYMDKTILCFCYVYFLSNPYSPETLLRKIIMIFFSYLERIFTCDSKYGEQEMPRTKCNVNLY